MTIAGALAAPLLRIYCTPRARAFTRALDDVTSAQRCTLARIIKASAATDYGRSLHLRRDAGIAEFRDRVPLVDYSVLEPWIQKQRAERRPIITPGRIRCYEPTSGSSSAAKWIPYNDALLGSFRSMFAIWAGDLLAHTLHPRSGRTFISVSSTANGKSEGFDDDREYLGGLLRNLVGRFLVLPPKAMTTQSPEQFRDGLVLALMNSADLEILSIWNPSYLLVLLEHFQRHRERLLPAFAPARRAVLTRTNVQWHEVWPELQLISCWADAAAASPALQLKSLFPQAVIQGKGLLATEAPVTIPLIGSGGCVPLVDEIFIELEDRSGRLHLLQEAITGTEYAVVITQAGGFLRYRLGDRVKVTGWHRNAPLLQFIGRADAVSDLVGEKLGEEFVAQALRDLAPAAFCTLLPVQAKMGASYYCLLTDDPRPSLHHSLEAALMKSYRYREARWLGQLEAVRIISQPQMRSALHDALIVSGMKAGDIKDRALMTSLTQAQKIYTQCVEN